MVVVLLLVNVDDCILVVVLRVRIKMLDLMFGCFEFCSLQKISFVSHSHNI